MSQRSLLCGFQLAAIRICVGCFVDLKNRELNVLDDGRVEAHMSLADKQQLEDIDKR